LKTFEKQLEKDSKLQQRKFPPGIILTWTPSLFLESISMISLFLSSFRYENNSVVLFRPSDPANLVGADTCRSDFH
jgi:hypothetical protein